MLFLVVADNQSVRLDHVKKVIASFPESEVLRYDDTYGKVTDLEQYLYPSLFTMAPPVVHVRFMLTSEPDVLNGTFLKKLLASPTVFLFEEMSTPSPIVTSFTKAGATVHAERVVSKIKKDAGIFAATSALTARDKKSRWMAYRNALTEHPIEAIIGILYWKIRDLAAKDSAGRQEHLALYRALLLAHARAWETGAPLELLIEKVLLEA